MLQCAKEDKAILAASLGAGQAEWVDFQDFIVVLRVAIFDP